MRIVIIGAPGSGKSTLSNRVFAAAGYEVINMDTLGSQAKCLKLTRAALQEGKSVVVDNTNPTVATRGKYLDLARGAGAPARCIVLSTSMELALHLNHYRQLVTNGERRRVPIIAFHTYNKRYEEPTAAEGFTSVVTVALKLEFAYSADRDLFSTWAYA